MKFDVITIGGATEDIAFLTKEGVLIDNKEDVLRQRLLAFEFGAKIKIDKTRRTFGGGAANAAVGMSLLGLRTACLAAIGDDDRGRRILVNFKNKNVDISLVQILPEEETGYSFVLVAQGNEHVVFSNRAANKELRAGEREMAELAQSEWVYLTSLSGDWKKSLENIFSVAGPKIAWNPGHIQLNSGIRTLGKYLKKTEVLVVNKDEAIELVVSSPKYKKKDTRFLNTIKNLLVAIKDFGPRLVIVTNGAQGATAYDGANFYQQPAIKEKKRMDTTGVGDAFGSSVVAGLNLWPGDIKKAMYLAAKNTASVIAVAGAQNGLLTIEDTKKWKSF